MSRTEPPTPRLPADAVNGLPRLPRLGPDFVACRQVTNGH